MTPNWKSLMFVCSVSLGAGSVSAATLSLPLNDGPVRAVETDCDVTGIRADLGSVDVWRKMLPNSVGSSLDGSIRVEDIGGGQFRVSPGLKGRPNVFEVVCVGGAAQVSCALDPRNRLKNGILIEGRSLFARGHLGSRGRRNRLCGNSWIPRGCRGRIPSEGGRGPSDAGCGGRSDRRPRPSPRDEHPRGLFEPLSSQRPNSRAGEGGVRPGKRAKNTSFLTATFGKGFA